MSKRLLLPILILFVLSGFSMGEDEPKQGTFYPFSELGITKTEMIGTKIRLTFKPTDEQFYWCPGAKIQSVKQGTVVTFVRCKTSQSCHIDQKAAIGKRLIRTITIDTRGKDTYVRTGPKKFKRIYEAPRKPTKSVTIKRITPKPISPKATSTSPTSTVQ